MKCVTYSCIWLHPQRRNTNIKFTYTKVTSSVHLLRYILNHKFRPLLFWRCSNSKKKKVQLQSAFRNDCSICCSRTCRHRCHYRACLQYQHILRCVSLIHILLNTLSMTVRQILVYRSTTSSCHAVIFDLWILLIPISLSRSQSEYKWTMRIRITEPLYLSSKAKITLFM